MSLDHNCILCQQNCTQRISGCANYFLCFNCDLRFLDPILRLDAESEKKRYDSHNNDVNDVRYRNFVQPLYDEIIKRARQQDLGLDYGCGPGPMIAKMLGEVGIALDLYDPFYGSSEQTFKRKYNFIYASESVEHFFYPYDEFKKIKNYLHAGGFLALMTHIYDESIDFCNWYYRKDPTHVSFYSEKTLNWIC